MKRFFIFVFIYILGSCTSPSSSQNTPAATPAAIEGQPTSTIVAAIATFTALPPTAPPPPAICDPFTVDFCISDGHFILQRPIHPPGNTIIDLTYAYASTAQGARDPHHGVEFLNRFGTPVHAAADGVVVFAGPDDQAVYSPWSNFYGNVIVIQHAGDLYTLYAHLSTINVFVDQSVFAGEKIGEVGQSGVATGSHLHFEVRRGDQADYFATENPELWLKPNTGENGAPLGAIQIAIRDQAGQLVPTAEVTLQWLDDQDQPIGNTYYLVTYEKSMLTGDENLGMSDLPVGKYRIAMQYAGQLRERWVEVQSGKLTQVVFTVK